MKVNLHISHNLCGSLTPTPIAIINEKLDLIERLSYHFNNIANNKLPSFKENINKMIEIEYAAIEEMINLDK